jgi:hypothetical protein
MTYHLSEILQPRSLIDEIIAGNDVNVEYNFLLYSYGANSTLINFKEQINER